MDADGFVPVVEVTRGDRVESIHCAALAVCDADGALLAQIGDGQRIVYWRSAAKPFQAWPLVASGAAARFRLTEPELAVACASHSGEPFHLDLVRSMLSKGGLTESDLRCGPHPPFYPPAAADLLRRGLSPGAVHNNCSGKHAGMLLLATHLGAEPAAYLEPDSPVQREIRRRLATYAGVGEEEIGLAIDGCSAPTFALPLARLATAYAGLIRAMSEAGGDAALASIGRAMAGHPVLVAGTGRIDTALMQALPGRLIAKVGAEGIYAIGARRDRRAIGLALKIADGDADRARIPLVIEALAALGVLTGEDLEGIRLAFPRSVHNRRGLMVGAVRVRGSLFPK